MADQVLFAQHDEVYILKFVGNIGFTLCPAVDNFLKKIFSEKNMCTIVIDLTETATIDSTALGLLAQIAIYSNRELQHKPSLLVSCDDILRLLRGMSFDKVFNILHETSVSSGVFQEIKPVSTDEKDMINRILSTHRTLIGLSNENKVKFENVIKVLEKEAQLKHFQQ